MGDVRAEHQPWRRLLLSLAVSCRPRAQQAEAGSSHGQGRDSWNLGGSPEHLEGRRQAGAGSGRELRVRHDHGARVLRGPSAVTPVSRRRGGLLRAPRPARASIDEGQGLRILALWRLGAGGVASRSGSDCYW